MNEIHHTDELFLSGEPTPAPEEQSTRFVDVHIYHLPPGEQEPPHVESEPAPAPQHERNQEPQARAGTRRFSGRVLVSVGMSSLLGGVLAMLFLLAIQPPPAEATITIVPIEQQITMTSTITVATGQTANAAQVPGRTLAAVTMSQQQTIPTTGTAYQDATAAHGSLTFYNAAPFAQTIVAGTLLTGADGVQIVTDQDVTMPAVSYPTLGQASITAHAVTTGPAGNIRAGDIYGPCCRLNVSAVNSAFTGGQAARDYRTVTQQDISTVATSLRKGLMQSEQAALQTQVRSEETLITPLPCQQSITPDHRPGEEATQVHIIVSETCTGTVYNTLHYQNQITQVMNQQARKQRGEGYSLTGTLHSTIIQVAPAEQNHVTLQVSIAGTYAYQFTQEQVQSMQTLVRGKSTAQATNALLQLPGVQSVAISTTKKNAPLPTSEEHIHVLLLQREGTLART